jgi:hypothetical protein
MKRGCRVNRWLRGLQAAAGHNRDPHGAGTPKWRACHVEEVPPNWLRSAAVHVVHTRIQVDGNVFYESTDLQTSFFTPKWLAPRDVVKHSGQGPRSVGNTDNCGRLALQHILVFII